MHTHWKALVPPVLPLRCPLGYLRDFSLHLGPAMQGSSHRTGNRECTVGMLRVLRPRQERAHPSSPGHPTRGSESPLASLTAREAGTQVYLGSQGSTDFVVRPAIVTRVPQGLSYLPAIPVTLVTVTQSSILGSPLTPTHIPWPFLSIHVLMTPSIQLPA